MPNTSLGAAEHRMVQELIQQYEVGDDGTKIVAIRDDLADVFQPHILTWRLLPDQVGIHPTNRDFIKLTAGGCQLRGKRILASGFSYASIGQLWASEDNPSTKHIERHTKDILMSNEEFAPPVGIVKVGPLNWTHSNQFCRMVDQRRPCSTPGIPVDRDNRRDKAAIQSDTKQSKLFAYLTQGMEFKVLPYWVEEQYPAVVKIFSVAANQEQQVQEGRGSNLNLQHTYIQHAYIQLHPYVHPSHTGSTILCANMYVERTI
jgi:hypothetical protein